LPKKLKVSSPKVNQISGKTFTNWFVIIFTFEDNSLQNNKLTTLLPMFLHTELLNKECDDLPKALKNISIHQADTFNTKHQ
jgi:hypothetical protein